MATPLLLAVTYRLFDAPTLSAKNLMVHCGPGLRAEAEFKITHHRSPSDSKINLVPGRCVLDGFKIIDRQTTTGVDRSAIPGNLSEVAVDTTVVRLKSDQTFSYGEFRSLQQLAFNDGTKQSLVITVSVKHPFVPALGHVFAGKLTAGQHWATRVPVRRSQADCRIAKVTHEGCSTTAEIVDGVLSLSGSAPSVQGRFAGIVTIDFQPETIPAVQIPVSGIVIPHATK